MDINPNDGVNSLNFSKKFKLGIKSKPIIFILIAIIAGLLAGGFWYWQRNKTTTPLRTEEEPVNTLGGSIFDKSTNPLKDELPEANPFKTQKNPFEVETNPFAAAVDLFEKTNPFTDVELNPITKVLKNPFK